MSLDDLLDDACQHDVQPVPGDEDWGRCVRCDEDGFPLTDRAAYGDFACGACKDTGLVPVCLDGQVGTRKDGSTFIHNGTLADARCTAPGCKAGRDEPRDAFSSASPAPSSATVSRCAGRESLSTALPSAHGAGATPSSTRARAVSSNGGRCEAPALLARVARVAPEPRPAQARQVALRPLPQTLDGVVNMDLYCPCAMCESNRRLMRERRVKADVYKGRLTLDGATLRLVTS